MTDPRRLLPSVGVLLESEAMRPLLERFPRSVVVGAVRDALDSARSSQVRAPESPDEWASIVGADITLHERRNLQRVFNATGVVLHTNLGRAPLADGAVQAITHVAAGYATLEYDLERGERGSRHVHCRELLCELTGADDALVVNNCAAALVLALDTLSHDREAIVSRGELIEIGGSFRVPAIMEKSGALLVEVGTTNRTHLADYERALGPRTGAIVKVHRSNFTIEGYTAEVSLERLAEVAQRAAVPLIHDFGSGLMLPLEQLGLHGEPTARDVVRTGATVVMSGDKLLGGPQAGIILGPRATVARMLANPLTRALRVDKLTIAALQATLALYREPARAMREIPILAMLSAPVGEVRARADRLAQRLDERRIPAQVVESDASVGGGAFPAARIESWAVHITGSAVQCEELARGARVPIIGRISDGRFLLDLRTIPPRDDAALATTLVEALAAQAS